MTRSPALPRYATRHRDYRPNNSERLIEIAKQIGQPPMPWQIQVFKVLGELLTEEEAEERGVPFGTPAYRQIWITVPRQSGKTTIVLVAMLDRCLFWGHYNATPQHIRYTSTNGKVARKKLINDMYPLMKRNKHVNRHIEHMHKGVGHEEILFKSGATIHPGNNTDEDGHGETLDLPIIDEAWIDEDFSREQGLRPAMNTRTQAQLIGTSTAGNASSVLLKRKTKRGREAVAADTGYGFAYFEWSAPEDVLDYMDEELWWKVHPALGHTMAIATMRDEMEDLPADEAKRAWLNIPSERLNTSHISPQRWAEVCGPYSALAEGAKVIAVDVANDRSSSAIAICNTATMVTELVDYEKGTAWLKARANHLAAVHKATIVYDQAGPVANIAKDHKQWEGVGGPEFVMACSDFYDDVVAEDIRIRACDEIDDTTGDPHPAAKAKTTLDLALAGADVRRTADKWAWSRSQSVGDISPLIAVTLASAYRPAKRKLKPMVRKGK